MRTALASILLLAAAVPIAAQDDLPKLVEELGGPDANKRSAALTALRSRKDPRALPLVETAIPRFGDMGRYYAVLYIDGCPPKATKPVWRRLFAAEDPWLRLSAATALYRMGERRMAGPIAKALLAPGPDEAKRVRMIYRANSIPEPKVLEALRRFVTPGGKVNPMGAALTALSNVRDRGSIPTVAALMKDDRPGVRAMGAAWLFRMGDPTWSKELAAALRTGKVEANEFSRVYSLLYSAPTLPEDVLAAMTALLDGDEGNSSILTNVIRLLAKSRYRKAVGAIRRLLDHRVSMVSKAAFEALLSLEGGLDTEAVRPLLGSDDVEKRLMAADALRRLNDHSGLPVVLEVLKDGSPGHRAEAARVLGGFRVPAAVEPLLTALADRHSTVRMRAVASLSSVLVSLFPYRRLNFATAGYSWSATPEANRAGIAAIRAFWEAHRDGDW